VNLVFVGKTKLDARVTPAHDARCDDTPWDTPGQKQRIIAFTERVAIRSGPHRP